MNILHLTLKKKWFDMILSGEKKEEYRDMKPYWNSRLRSKKTYLIRQYDLIVFKNGYSKNARVMSVESKGIQMREGKKEWGAEPGKHYFVLMIGKIVSKPLNNKI